MDLDTLTYEGLGTTSSGGGWGGGFLSEGEH